jgi:hypothetical protein
VNPQGYTEANASIQFQARFIPLFQFLAFYANDLEVAPGETTAVFNGRMHTNGDLYLSEEHCPPGAEYFGQFTIVGSGISGTVPLTRGRKFSTGNRGEVQISLDGSASNLQALGAANPADTCEGNFSTPPRQVPQSEINTFNGRIQTGVKTISLPSEAGTVCTPWVCTAATAGTYWQRADLRIVLDLSAGLSQALGGAQGPTLFPIEVFQADGTIDAAKTAALKTLMLPANRPGVITYTDVPKTTNTRWNCWTNGGSSLNPRCEGIAAGGAGTNTGYWTTTNYTPAFPAFHQPTCPSSGSFPGRDPRTAINVANYCYDYRYGGFFSWREGKPLYILNIDWIGLEEYNRSNGNPLFNPSGTATNCTASPCGLVVFLTVKGPNSGGANNYAVRIFDAARARYGSTDPGVAFATDQAMYLVGDFNCPQPDVSGASLTVPPICGSTPDTPTYKKPVSVAADTFNVLSCAWIQTAACPTPGSPGTYVQMDLNQWPGVGVYRPIDDHGTNISMSTGPWYMGYAAKDTLVNVAILAGTDSTWCPGSPRGIACGAYTWPSPSYSGGFESFIRYSEEWLFLGGPYNFYWQGSFFNTGTPLHTCFAWATQLTVTANDTAPYACAKTAPSGYSSAWQGFMGVTWSQAPTRYWYYDTTFDNVDNLPVLTPRVVMLNEVYFTQQFQ